ncbi:hypothetical protein BBJ28_00024322 [Nothophytophthora sp. Chile5]|nr:hypothetical protein BBJ28_00024322 [Nothophytophthora sp. Chile5]
MGGPQHSVRSSVQSHWSDPDEASEAEWPANNQLGFTSGENESAVPLGAEEEGPLERQYLTKPTSDPIQIPGSKQVWVVKRTLAAFRGGVHLKTSLAMKKRQARVRTKWTARFTNMVGFAQWVFDTARHGAVQLDIDRSEYKEEARDALLRQFHRWPESELARAAQQCQTLSQEVEQQCGEQIELYIQELRGKLVSGASALFWLDLLLPLLHRSSVPVQEAKETLRGFLQELKAVDCVCEQLIQRLWAMLTLPLKIEPLLRGVGVLLLCGHEVSAKEGLQLLGNYAEYTARTGTNEGQFPLGLSIVSSIGEMVPLDVVALSDLPEALRAELATPLSVLKQKWLVVVEEVLAILSNALMAQWVACGRAPHENVFQDRVHSVLTGAFARFRDALATNQLYALQRMSGSCSNGQQADRLVVVDLQKSGCGVVCSVQRAPAL